MTGVISSTATATILELTSFMVAGEEFGIDIRGIEEIVRLSPITRVPRTPVHILGVINLRGRIVPVIDLRLRLGFEPLEATKATRIIITLVSGISVGLKVDSVREVLRLDSETISPPPEVLTEGMDTSVFRGIGQIGDRLITIFSLVRLLEIVDATIRLGEALISVGYIGMPQLDDALSTQAASGGLLGKILVDKGYCTNDQIMIGLALQKERQL